MGYRISWEDHATGERLIDAYKKAPKGARIHFLANIGIHLATTIADMVNDVPFDGPPDQYINEPCMLE